jgi:mRNA-degrading endonuclease RelE of RelBE toxin-antitoxin system
MPRLFGLEWAPLATMELDALRSFDRPAIRRAVDELRHQALAETTNRKPLQAPLSALPEATWQIRIGRHRVLYRIDGRTVRILRVILKAGTTGESL